MKCCKEINKHGCHVTDRRTDGIGNCGARSCHRVNSNVIQYFVTFHSVLYILDAHLLGMLIFCGEIYSQFFWVIFLLAVL